MSKLSDTLRGLAVELGAESPLDEGTPGSPGAAAQREYPIYTSAGRIYIQDAVGKVVALGDLLEDGHVYRYELDEGDISGEGFPDLGSTLRDLSAHLTFAYVDGLFRNQIDVADEASLHSVSAPAIRLRLTPDAV